jgi:hypothetical protein
MDIQKSFIVQAKRDAAARNTQDGPRRQGGPHQSNCRAGMQVTAHAET